MQHAVQRAVQIASVAVTCAQVYAYWKTSHARAAATRDEKFRRALNAQLNADRDAARPGWAPALDPNWLRHAGLRQTATAWGAAMPYADQAAPWYEPLAEAAMRRCEDRLRDLHPYAMARYDRLRADGMTPSDAMREAAPFFCWTAPRVRPALHPAARTRSQGRPQPRRRWAGARPNDRHTTNAAWPR